MTQHHEVDMDGFVTERSCRDRHSSSKLAAATLIAIVTLNTGMIGWSLVAAQDAVRGASAAVARVETESQVTVQYRSQLQRTLDEMKVNNRDLQVKLDKLNTMLLRLGAKPSFNGIE